MGFLRGLLLMAAMGLVGCDTESTQPAEPEALRTVETLQLVAEPFIAESVLPGRIEPVRVADVRARVAGIVLSKHFAEGADVKAGDLLFEIDPAPFKAAVALAEGNVARADAAVFEARALFDRYQQLVKSQAISQQNHDSANAALRSAQASLLSARAELEIAHLNLGYTRVKAPISGRIGRALVTEGALVGQGDATLMARIQQLHPIYADFTQPVAEALRIRETFKTPAAGDEARRLSLSIEGTQYERQGTLMFADIEVDRSTSQLSLRGRFDNEDGLLLPGMYVRIRVPQASERQAVFVPQRAIQREASGAAYVFVLSADSLAQRRDVVPGPMHGSRWQILEGLESGDVVIVGGLHELASGEQVVVKSSPVKEDAGQ